MRNTTLPLAGQIGLGLSSCLWLLCSWRLIYHTFIRRRCCRKNRGISQEQQPQQQQQSPSTEPILPQPSTPNACFSDTVSSGCSTNIVNDDLENNDSHYVEEQPLQSLTGPSGEATAPDNAPLYYYRNASKKNWFTRRRTFHVLLWLSSTFQIIAYADLSQLFPPMHHNAMFTEKISYILLDVVGRSVLELLAFCTITGMWLKTALAASSSSSLSPRPARHFLSHKWMSGLFLVTTILLVLALVTISILVLILYPEDPLWETPTSSPPVLLQIQTVLEAVTWGIHSLVVLECITMTSKQIFHLVLPPTTPGVVSSSHRRSIRSRRMVLWTKAVFPMVLASLVYAWRCFWLLALQYEYHRHSNGGDNNGPFLWQRETWSWWIGFVWCPTWIAVSTSLYSARKRDLKFSLGRTPDFYNTQYHYRNDDNDWMLQQPLLMSSSVTPTPRRRLRPPPPEEAFRAFSQHLRRGSREEDLDDSFPCQSPMQTVLAYRMDRGDDDHEPDSCDHAMVGAVADEETLSTDSERGTRSPLEPN